MSTERETWQRANRDALAAEIAVVTAQLRGDEATPPPPAVPRSALDLLAAACGLSGFERSALVMCAGAQFDRELAGALAARGNLAPTFDVALARLPGAHWSALSPWGPLRYWHLVEVEAGPLTTAVLRLDEWALHVLLGNSGLDGRLAGVIRPVRTSGPIARSTEAAGDHLCTAWLQRETDPVVLIRGASPAVRRAVFAEACRLLTWRPYVIDAADLPSAPDEREGVLRRWEREAMLDSAALLIDAGADNDDPALRRIVDRFVDRLTMPAAIAVDEHGRAGTRPLPTVHAVKPTADEQRAQWSAALGKTDGFGSLNGALDRLVAQFDLDALHAAAGETITDPSPPGPPEELLTRVTATQTRQDQAARERDMPNPAAPQQTHLGPLPELGTFAFPFLNWDAG